jgi:hypothetical protein
MVWIFGVGEYLQRFFFEHQSFLFSVSYWGNPLLHNDHIPCLTYDNCGGCRTTQCVVRRFCQTVLPLGSHSWAQIDYLVEPSNFRNALLLWRSFLCRSSLVSLLSR